jgi:hypothetical protein
MGRRHDITTRVCQKCHANNLVFFLPDLKRTSTFEITCPECDKTTQEAFWASKIFRIAAQHALAPRSVDYNPPLLPMRQKKAG